MEEIAELLKSSREEYGIELEEVCKDIGIEEIILRNIEEGKIGAFKDIFLLKEYISSYAKYLGLDSEKVLEEFNEYLFNYTSRIPIQDIEKTIKKNNKGENEEKVYSPYTHRSPKSKKWIYILVYLAIFLVVFFAIAWSINQMTIERRNAYVVSYRK